MVKKMLILCIVFSVMSCFYTRSEYGNIRFKPYRFTIKPNSNDEVFKIIDTTKIYEMVDAINIKYNQRPTSLKKAFLKFYANGRVGEFATYDENDIKSLDPRKAKMAYYNFDGKELVIQSYFESPQGGGLITAKIHKIDNDSLELINSEYLYKYEIISLPKEFLIYKPDW